MEGALERCIDSPSSIYIGAHFWQTRNLLDNGASFPQISYSTLSGESFSSQDLKGKSTVFYVFAPWCTVCDLTSGSVQSLSEWISGDSFQVLGLALSYENSQSVKEFRDDHELEIPVILGSDMASEQLRIEAFPTFVFIDDEGTVKGHTVGYTSFLGLLARAYFFK